MRVLCVASEAIPFVKSGGLADVVGTLPKFLAKQKVKMDLILPLYSSIDEKYKKKMELVKELNLNINWRNQYCGLKKMELNDITCYFIDNEQYFKRDSLYDYYDESERFTFFSKAVLEVLPYLDQMPDIIHTNDWHTALINVYLKTIYKNHKDYSQIKTIFTIHNLKYQGRFSKRVFEDVVTLPKKYFSKEHLEFYGDVNYMKGGIVYADVINTVSQTYSKEIMGEYFGEGLDGVLRERHHDLYGILNGLDYSEYSPLKDKKIYFNYRTSHGKKLKNKNALQEEMGLEVNSEKPLLSIVSRFSEQKGMDLIDYNLEKLLKKDIQLVVLGNGERRYEEMFRYFAERYPDKMKLIIGFSEEIAHKIYAGADIFLMPSRFEPCGISQLIALNYGNIPIVREVGGLKDTIEPFDEFEPRGNGFSFLNYNGEEFMKIIEYALEIYSDKDMWGIIFKNALKSRFDWNNSAKEYKKLYKMLLKSR